MRDWSLLNQESSSAFYEVPMPQVSDPNDQPGDPQEPTGVKLQTSELDDFLWFLFLDVARRPAALKIRECMRVARYLDWLAADGVPKKILRMGRSAVPNPRRPSAEERDEKQCAQHIADVLWARVRRLNEDHVASNTETLRFLKLHEKTYFVNPFIVRAIDLVKDFDVPATDMRARPKPNLVSASMASFRRDPHMQNDLSEGLLVADFVLKGAGVRRRLNKIAVGLNACGVQTPRRRGRDPAEQTWLPEEVHERIKAFEKRMRLQQAKVPAHNFEGIGAGGSRTNSGTTMDRSLPVDPSKSSPCRQPSFPSNCGRGDS